MQKTYHELLSLQRTSILQKQYLKRRRDNHSNFLAQLNLRLKRDPPTSLLNLSIYEYNSLSSIFDDNHNVNPICPIFPHYFQNCPTWPPELEDKLLQLLCSWNPDKPPVNSWHLSSVIYKYTSYKVPHSTLLHILDKLSFYGLITVNKEPPSINFMDSNSEVLNTDPQFNKLKSTRGTYVLSYVDVYKIKAYLDEGEVLNQNIISQNIDELSGIIIPS